MKDFEGLNPGRKRRTSETGGLGPLIEIVVTLVLPRNRREEFLGDLLEEWSTEIVPKLGPTRARLWLGRQVVGSVFPIVGARLRRVPLVHKLLVVTSIVLGLFFAYVDSRPNWDDAGILAFAMLASSGILGALGPRQPWLWALGVGVWLPMYYIVVGHSYDILLVLVFPFTGAYAGMAVRRIVVRATHGTRQS